MTEWVDTNLTFEFQVGDDPISITNIDLVDNSGFVNAPRHFNYDMLTSKLQSARACIPRSGHEQHSTGVFLNHFLPQQHEPSELLSWSAPQTKIMETNRTFTLPHRTQQPQVRFR